jgi:hypothetical protein
MRQWLFNAEARERRVTQRKLCLCESSRPLRLRVEDLIPAVRIDLRQRERIALTGRIGTLVIAIALLTGLWRQRPGADAGRYRTPTSAAATLTPTRPAATRRRRRRPQRSRRTAARRLRAGADPDSDGDGTRAVSSHHR